MQNEPSTLSRAELVSALLEPQPPAQNRRANAASRRGADRVGMAPVERHGLNDVVARKLAIARELLLRDLHEALRSGPVMDSPHHVRDWLRLHFAGLQYETFSVLYLDAQHRLIDAVEMFRGTLSQTAVYPREIVRGSLAHNAAAVVFAHNHPSGCAEPSRADEMLTQTLKTALALVDVRVIDHFVVAGDVTVSFAERNLI